MMAIKNRFEIFFMNDGLGNRNPLYGSISVFHAIDAV
jgi:hypothetical protein